MSVSDNIKNKLALLPAKPGCYLMKDFENNIIYVGKSKNLKNRVRSYFSGAHDSKTTKLVSEIIDFEYIITSSELEALLLELNLIKKHSPKFNIMLRDDKTYPFITISNEENPRLLITRKINKKQTSFGPYPNVKAAREVLKLLNKLYPLRLCKNLPKKECLYYHIGQCIGPCIKKINENEYKEIKNEITSFLNGNTKEVIEKLKDKMLKASELLQFEKANEYKVLIEHINETTSKQKMILSDLTDRDIFGYYVDKGYMSVQVFFMRGGKIVARDSNVFPYYEEPKETFLTFLGQFYEKNNIIPKEIVLQDDEICDISAQLLKTKALSPSRGDKKKLVSLAIVNAENVLKQEFELATRDDVRVEEALSELKELLEIESLGRIDIFDNSHISGSDSVSAMVVYLRGFASKKDYRKYKLLDTNGDDVKAMKQVIYRRYYRVLMENLQKTDLIIVDGGLAQVRGAKQVIDELNMKIKIIGLVKDEKHRTYEMIDGCNEDKIHLDKRSSLYYLLTQMQEEVHRFAISFHRKTRNKKMTYSLLDQIEGIGPKTKKKLLKYFGSIKKIKEANLVEITDLGISLKVAERLKSELNN